jgi:D-alanyl-lipoteichoic acid acyltransferase DltB (MBOAT superfamily)
MLFNSFTFLLAFTPVVLACHWLIKRNFPARYAQVFLLVASLAFYSWNRPLSNLLPLTISALFNFGMAYGISMAAHPLAKKRILILGLTGNVLFLVMLKYARFAQETLLFVTGIQLPVPEFALPLGVSFFTLQQVMYLVDCYEELVPPSRLLDHASFVAFFPYLSMGPLVRARQVLPQLRTGGVPNAEWFARGSLLMAMGLCKKVLLAEPLATLADGGFTALPAPLSCVEAWISALAYTLQIYFDFSGYTDMAIGIALMLGIQLPPNFRSPYRALSIIDFWQRWHITLSQFITTYLYTPIIRSFRKATLLTAAIATLAAMTIAGLWHGPSWNFVLFGTIHGVALVVNQYWRKKVRLKLPSSICWLLTMGVVVVAFVFFRAATLPDAVRMLQALIPGPPFFGYSILRSGSLGFIGTPIIFLGAILVATVGPNSNEWAGKLHPTPRAAAAVAALLLVGVFYLNSTTAREFIYFAF